MAFRARGVRMSIPTEIFYATPLVWVLAMGLIVNASEKTEERLDQMQMALDKFDTESAEEPQPKVTEAWEEVIGVLKEVKEGGLECAQPIH